MNQGLSLVSVLKRRWVPAIAVMVATLGAALAYLATAKSEYLASARLIVDDRSVSISELGQELSAARIEPPGDANPLATESEIIRSQSVIERAINLLKEEGFPVDELVAEEIADGLSVDIIPATNILEVTYRTAYGERAAAVLNAIMMASTEQSAEAIRLEASTVRAFLEAEVPTLQSQLTAAETAESDYRQQSGLVAGDVQTERLIDTLSSLVATESDLTADLEGTLGRERQLRQITNVADLPQAYGAVQIGQNPELQDLRQDLLELEAQVIESRSRLGDQHPDLLAVLERRDETSQLYRQQVAAQAPNVALGASPGIAGDALSQDLISQLIIIEAERSDLEGRLAVVRQERDRLEGQLYDLPSQKKPLATLMRNKEDVETSLALLQNKLEEARLAEAQLIGNLRIIDRATAPNAAEWPQPLPVLLLAIAAGSVLATGIVLLLELLDDSVHSASEIESLTRLPHLGTLPVLPEEALHFYQPNAFLDDPALVEPYRMLLQNITHTRKSLGQVVVVSSCCTDEGKSVVTSHLAAVSSLLLRRTLIIDMDLRRPSQASTFHHSPKPGVTTVLSGEHTLTEAIQSTALENLWILPHGDVAHRPSVLLEQVINSDLLKNVAQHFDYIFLDTPPVSSCADALMLAQQSDGMVLVVRADFTPRAALQQSASMLKNSGVSVLGTVMNGATTPAELYYHIPVETNGAKVLRSPLYPVPNPEKSVK